MERGEEEPFAVRRYKDARLREFMVLMHAQIDRIYAFMGRGGVWSEGEEGLMLVRELAWLCDVWMGAIKPSEYDQVCVEDEVDLACR